MTFLIPHCKSSWPICKNLVTATCTFKLNSTVNPHTTYNTEQLALHYFKKQSHCSPQQASITWCIQRVALYKKRFTLYSLGLMGEKSSGTCFLISSGCPPSASQNPGGSWFCMRVVISAFPLRSFLFIFSANNLENGNNAQTQLWITSSMGCLFVSPTWKLTWVSKKGAEKFVLTLDFCLTWPLWCCWA